MKEQEPYGSLEILQQVEQDTKESLRGSAIIIIYIQRRLGL